MGSRIWIGVICLFLLSACQRSDGYRRDQDYYKAESPSYYNKPGAPGVAAGPGAGGKTPTQRLESMGQPKKRLVILDFWNDTPVRQQEVGLFAADELRRGLSLSQRVILPLDAKSDRATEDFVNGDHVKVAQLIREGRRLGVAVLVIGRVSRVVYRIRGDDIGLLRQKQSIAAADVEMKVFDVNSGKEILASGKSGESSSSAMVAIEPENLESAEFRSEMTRLAVRNAVAQLVPDVVRAVEKMTWEGHVAKIVGKKIYLNAGKTSGIAAGDILKVMTQGEDVVDPATGAFLGRAPGQLKGTVEVVDFIGADGAVGEVHTGGNIREGDIVQLY